VVRCSGSVQACGWVGWWRAARDAAPADLLADATHQALAGHQPANQALARYQQRRDALTASEFELTLSTDLAAGTAGGGLIVGWKAVLSAYLSGHGSMINGNALS
jgi:hypothetical protein